jgi:hypothetical protein
VPHAVVWVTRGIDLPTPGPGRRGFSENHVSSPPFYTLGKKNCAFSAGLCPSWGSKDKSSPLLLQAGCVIWQDSKWKASCGVALPGTG